MDEKYTDDPLEDFDPFESEHKAGFDYYMESSDLDNVDEMAGGEQRSELDEAIIDDSRSLILQWINTGKYTVQECLNRAIILNNNDLINFFIFSGGDVHQAYEDIMALDDLHLFLVLYRTNRHDFILEEASRLGAVRIVEYLIQHEPVTQDVLRRSQNLSVRYGQYNVLELFIKYFPDNIDYFNLSQVPTQSYHD